MLKPASGEVTVSVVRDALSLIGIKGGRAQRWGKARLEVAYDYAMREHLAASDVRIRRVKRPRWLR